MFDLFAMLLSSIASFLFPIFASYKALKSSDPSQLTPWLMYWVVFSCCILVESWLSFVLYWVPFYGYIRLIFFLYLILPQTQGARIIYEEYVHPFLEDNEGQIDDFIASAHDRLKAAGIAYLRQAIEYLKTNILGRPASDPEPTPEPHASQTYTQGLLARFSVPSARWAAAASPNSDFQNLLASAVSAITTAATGTSGGPSGAVGSAPSSARLIPSHIRDSHEKMSFIAAQRERLNFLLTALDREAQALQQGDASDSRRVPSMAYDGTPEDEEVTQRPPSGLSGWSSLSKSRSEVDFEKIDAESGAEDNDALRRRNVSSGSGGGSWMPWGWGGQETPGQETPGGRSTGFDQ